MSAEMEVMWNEMVEFGFVTEEELGLAVALCGNTIETLERVLYIRTGYRSMDQLYEELGWNDEDEEE